MLYRYLFYKELKSVRNMLGIPGINYRHYFNSWNSNPRPHSNLFPLNFLPISLIRAFLLPSLNLLHSIFRFLFYILSSSTLYSSLLVLLIPSPPFKLPSYSFLLYPFPYTRHSFSSPSPVLLSFSFLSLLPPCSPC